MQAGKSILLFDQELIMIDSTACLEYTPERGISYQPPRLCPNGGAISSAKGDTLRVGGKTVAPNAQVPVVVDGERFVRMFLDRIKAP